MLLSDKAKALVTEKYSNNKEKRLKHIYGVAEMANNLARKYDINPEKALIAAYMHDYCKYDDISVIEASMPMSDIKECRQYNFLYHAYGSANAYKEFFKDSFDIDIYNAIRNHVFGRVGMSPLEELIMISDYTEMNREYKECIICRNILLEGKKNTAIAKSLEFTMALVTSLGQNPHPEQIKIYNEYLEKIKRGEE